MLAASASLGRLQGGAVLGRPLDVSVPLQDVVDDEVQGLCADVQVRFGDALLLPAQVIVDRIGATRLTGPALHVRTASNVDEPTVALSVQVGCVQKISKRYVLLSDMLPDGPTEPVVAAGPSPAVAAGSYAGTAPDTVPGATAPAGGAANAAPSSGLAPASRAASHHAPSRPVVRAVAHAAPGAVQNGHSRLVLSPDITGATARAPVTLDGLQQRIDTLAQQQDAVAAANMTPQLQTQLAALQLQIKTLQGLTIKNQQTLAAITAAAQENQSIWNTNVIVLVLLAVLSLSVVVLVVMVWRLRNASRQDATESWAQAHARADARHVRSSAQSQDNMASPVESVRASGPRTASAGLSSGAAVATMPVPPSGISEEAVIRSLSAKVAASVDIDIEVGDSAPVPATVSAGVGAATTSTSKPLDLVPKRSAPAPVEKREFVHSNFATLRSMDTKDMLDVRQQADFFMALGQHEKALKALEASIRQSDSANPLVYLDLLKLLYTLERRTDFDFYRREFNFQFTGIVPDYDHFMDEGNDLETYVGVCRQIVALWGTDAVIDYIEHCLVRSSVDELGHNFDLEAFRDLLLLHGLMRRMDREQDSDLMPFIASRMVDTSETVPNSELPGVETMEAPVLPAIPVVPAGAPARGSWFEHHTGETGQGALVDFDLSSVSKLGPLEPPKS